MSEVAQEAEASNVTDAPVPNPAQTQDKPVEKPEAEAEETEKSQEDSTETEGEEGEGKAPEKTVEEQLEELRQDNEAKQKKIDRQTAANSATMRKLEKEMQEKQALEAKINAQEPEQEPSIDDFEDFDEYKEALREFAKKSAKQEALKEIAKHNEQAKAQELMQERAKLALEQEAKYLEINPNYKASRAEFDAWSKIANISKEVEQAIVIQSFKGNVPQLIDYFGANSGENIPKLEEISRLSPVEAAVEIYKIQQSLKTPAPEEKKQPPKPLNKPKGSGKPRKDLGSMSGDEVLKHLGFKK